MYQNIIIGMFGSLIAAAFLVFGISDSNTYSQKFDWFVVMSLIIFMRFIDAMYWYFKLSGTDYDGNAAISRCITGAIATALLWSAFSVIFYEGMNEFEFAATMAILCSLAGGSNSTLVGHKLTASAFVLLMLVPISTRAALSDNIFHMYLGILGLMFSVAMSFSGFRAARLTLDTIKLRNQNTHLVAKMHQEIQQVDDVHKKLSEAYQNLNDTNLSLEQEVERRTLEIRELSDLDPLTQLYNRSAFIRQLNEMAQKCLARNNSIALLFIDLNGFKKINDTLGHKIGDAVLVEISSRLSAFANDYHAGRWGGDEFLMLLPYSDQPTAISVAQALMTRIAQPLDVMSNQLHLTASIGIAMLPEHTNNSLELIQLADFAMFEQKKNHAAEPRMFTPDLFKNLKEVEKLRDGLQRAIDKRELFLCYQPIVDCESKHPWSYEALLRWDFEGSLVSPDIFIPLAEQSGLIHDIGAWVLNRACIDASQWQHSLDASVSVNVSIIQLLDDGFIDILDRALATSKLAAERLHIEITESIFADNKKRVLAQLDAIQARNVQVSIDDFGTGYSSLSQLQTLNVDIVKIDRSFVQNIHHGGEAIIRATIFIANEFGSKTVAEGIETQHEADRLAELGVDFLQGFLFAEPMKNDDLRVWVQQHANSWQVTS
ncbi:GGDEF domain-containing phosphodiesterase [Aliiglaciecola sp. LCG003]|uniref:putative bifunctional diguanylate cyclase/phosphodiesterase n=1 Tax=Aliiglaciecola sp. LCG003 TaxID=3053655 RepID=UPI0025726E30|nr:GGDEF domain-containing phosphodiesterase [Aliiglaciecola sp. LCG003]WJG08622.1 EAL domain-containing protein [Aliiglaciecola sp. LCG003]